jgi:hypothetical protein
MENIKQHLFLSNPDKWEQACSVDRIIKSNLSYKVIKNGIILPLKKRTDILTQNGIYCGGACTENFKFIGGTRRDINSTTANLSCCAGYKVKKQNLKRRKEIVIFCGTLYTQHFGHMLIDSLSRMWYPLSEGKSSLKIVFVTLPGYNDLKYTDFFKLMGIPLDRIEIIKEPTQFEEIIVPDESGFSLSSAHSEWLIPYNRIRDNVRKLNLPSIGEKIYLSRKKYKKNDGINEEYFEKFFSKLGFVIVYPEMLTFAEQINIISSAKEIVSTIGAISHLFVFAKNNIRTTCILRDPNRIIYPQIVLNQLKQFDWYFVEATKSPLPIVHDHGIFLYIPTTYFISYLHSIGVSSNIEKNDMEISPQLLFSYIKKWTQMFSNTRHYKFVENKTLFDCLNALNYALYGSHLDRKKYKDPNDEILKLKKEINAMQSSLSWKVTKPFRFLSKKINDLFF